ncbi:MAG: hypothetical protein R8M14_02630 [Ghiorsea sp.]
MRGLLVLVVLLFSACTDLEKSAIDDLLDQRNQSISQKDIKNYTSLLSQTYLKKNGSLAIESMQRIFSSFDKVSLISRDRRIQINDENHAICEQTYVLKVFSDGQSRNIVRREQLKFTREHEVWKIDGGL